MRFLLEIENKYKDVWVNAGKLLWEDETFLHFQVGEHPCLPKFAVHCNSFLCFELKISGSCVDARQYIEQVYCIAKKYFGDRVHFWNDMYENSDACKWSHEEVHAAYSRLRAQEL